MTKDDKIVDEGSFRHTMRITALIGTRPEAIKLIPIVRELRRIDNIQMDIWTSGQHSDIVSRMLGMFSIYPDVDLGVFESGQSPSTTVGQILVALASQFQKSRPDWILVQGDTSTAVAGAMAGFYTCTRVVHLEAGLRSHDLEAPFPEEANRRLISVLTDIHLVQDEQARRNLVAEGVDTKKVVVVGNPGLDLLVGILKETKGIVDLQDLGINHLSGRRVVLVTVHRRENIGQPLINICNALQRIAYIKGDELIVLFPVHPNPVIQATVRQILGDLQNVLIMPPVDYPLFVKLLTMASLVITDSGGVQEEAVFLKKPLLILRQKTERSMGDDPSLVKLVDSSIDQIVDEALTFLQGRSGSYDKNRVDDYSMVSFRVAQILASLDHDITRRSLSD